MVSRADGGLCGCAHPAREQVQLDLRVADQPGGHRHGVGDHAQAQVAGQQRWPAGRSWCRRR